MFDTVETLGNSVIQHGPANDRIYLMKLHPDDGPQLAGQLCELAADAGYSKIFAKVPLAGSEPFLAGGYHVEALVPALYGGEEDGLFLGKYLEPERQQEEFAGKVEAVLAASSERATESFVPALEPGLEIVRAGPGQVEEMAGLYREVFATYPFPIHDGDYLARTMEEQVAYFGVWEEDRLLALASAEIDAAGSHAEMTDFATRPDCRGRGLAGALLCRMEEEVAREGIATAYTIARAYSFGMNVAFARNGYAFGGTLVNNTNIAGQLESMNVWHKPLKIGAAPE